ncbi:hypothetical protein E2320_009106 [Naja naja]|nr:hypothetical protein E2320_009106 [Naja naja]
MLCNYLGSQRLFPNNIYTMNSNIVTYSMQILERRLSPPVPQSLDEDPTSKAIFPHCNSPPYLLHKRIHHNNHNGKFLLIFLYECNIIRFVLTQW